MPANTAIIGRVAVKVLPDTTDFRKDAQRKLDAEEKRLEFVIPTRLDMTGASRQFLEELQKINARNRANDNRKIRFYTTISTNGMREELAKASRKYSELSHNNKVKLDADLVAGTAKLTLDKQSLDDVKKQIDHWRKQNDPVVIGVRLDIGNVSKKIAQVELAYLSRPREVRLLPKVDSKAAAGAVATLQALSGYRVVSEMFDHIADSIKNLDKSVPLIGSLALAIAGLAGWGLSAASNLAALSASLASILPAALSMPGLFAGIGVGLGITVLGFKDLKKALPDVYKQFQDMGVLISKDFWAGAKDGIRALATVYLPHLGSAAKQVGTFWGDLASALAKPFHQALGPMFANLTKSIQITSGASSIFADIITKLGLTGSEYLPRLAQWFVDISKKFDDWLTKAKNDGRLKQWIDTGIQALHDLGQVFKGVFLIFKGIGDAAKNAGGSSLGMMADTLSKIADVVNGPGFQKGLTETFSAAHQAMSLIAKQSGPAVKELFDKIAPLLANILPTAGKAIGTIAKSVSTALSQTGVTQGFINLFNGLASAIEALAPALAPIGALLGELGTGIGIFAKALGPLIGSLLPPLAGILTQVLKAAEPLVPILQKALGQAFAAIVPIVQTLVTTLLPVISSLIQGLVPIISSLVQALAPVIQQVVNALAPILPVIAAAVLAVLNALLPLVPVLLNLLTAILLPLLPAITAIASTALPPLAAALAGLVVAITPVLDALTGLVNFLMPILVPAIQFVADALIGSLTMAINGVANVFKGVTDFVMGVWSAFAGLFTGDWGRMWDGIKQVFSGIWELIKGIFEVAINVTILGKARDFFVLFKGLWKDGLEFVKGIFTGAIDYIKAAFSLFLTGLKEAPSAALDVIKMAFSDGWAAVKGIFDDAWVLLRVAVSEGLDKVKALLTGLPGKITSWVGDLGGVLLGAGKAIIQGLIDGISFMFDKVKGVLGKLTSLLPDWKGPASTDATLLYDAGTLIIGGLIDGMESRYDAVRKSLAGLTGDIGSTMVTPPDISSVGLARRMAPAIAGAYGGAEGVTKQLNYYAAPGSSIGSEEDLWAAAERARMVGW